MESLHDTCPKEQQSILKEEGGQLADLLTRGGINTEAFNVESGEDYP